MITFNINGYVKVKLTEAGIKELERQHRELRNAFPSIGEFKKPHEDENGYSKLQMYCLMNTFGHMLICGCELPFDTDIKLLGWDE